MYIVTEITCISLAVLFDQNPQILGLLIDAYHVS